MEESKDLKYDPMEGFKLDWREIEERNYLCVGKELDNSTEDWQENKFLLELVITNSTRECNTMGVGFITD